MNTKNKVVQKLAVNRYYHLKCDVTDKILEYITKLKFKLLNLKCFIKHKVRSKSNYSQKRFHLLKVSYYFSPFKCLYRIFQIRLAWKENGHTIYVKMVPCIRTNLFL